MNIKHKIVATVSVATMMLSSLAMSGVVHASHVAGHAYDKNPFTRGTGYVDTTSDAAGVKVGDLPTMIGKIINIVLGLLGIIFVVLAVYAGFKWMTAGGEEGPIEEAKDTLKNAIIGLAIVMASFAISKFVMDNVFEATKG